jgi:hypothetical protein
MLVAGTVYYIKELAKAYCRVADKLNKIADAIESGDTSASTNSNDDDFENLGKKLMSKKAQSCLPVRARAESGSGRHDAVRLFLMSHTRVFRVHHTRYTAHRASMGSSPGHEG